MCIIVNTHALYSHQNTMIFISLLPPAMRIRLSEKTLEIKWEDIGNYGVAILTSWAIKKMWPKIVWSGIFSKILPFKDHWHSVSKGSSEICLLM